MRMKKFLLLAVCAVAWGFVSGCALFMHKDSEQVVTLKVGPSWTHTNDVKHDFGPLGTFEAKNVDYDTGVAVGFGIEHWFGSLPYLGIGLDVEHFNANSPKQKTNQCFTGEGCARDPLDPFVSQHYNATALEFLLRARYGFMNSNEFPNGRYQLFALVGPAIFFANYFDAGHHFNFPNHQKDSDTTAGVTTGMGLRYMLTRNIDWSLEYRFKYFSPRFDVTEFGFGPAKIKTNLATSQLLFGLSYHFYNLFGGM